MRIIIYISLLMILTSFIIQLKFSEGIYEYKTEGFYESINLYKGYKFKYIYRLHSINYSIEGNYSLKGDSLILDSYPQKDKIIVREQNKGNESNVRFYVTDKLGAPINYTLYVINKEYDTLTLPNQWNSTKLKNKKIGSFYIVDSKGLKTPLYHIKGTRTNYFEIQMETDRVFENEVWKIFENKIFPIGIDGRNQSYFLKKLNID